MPHGEKRGEGMGGASIEHFCRSPADGLQPAAG
jgi:hypothetical protein